MPGVLEKRNLLPFEVLAHVLEGRTQEVAQSFKIVVAPALTHVTKEFIDFQGILKMALVFRYGEFDQSRNRQRRVPHL